MDYDAFIYALRQTQHGMCGICGTPLDRGCDVVDHDHRSGMVRGWLCRGCNTLEARHGDGCHQWIECAICSWRHRPATSWLGVTMLYRSTFKNSPTWQPGRVGTADEFVPTSRTAPAYVAQREAEGAARVAALPDCSDLVAIMHARARVQSACKPHLPKR